MKSIKFFFVTIFIAIALRILPDGEFTRSFANFILENIDSLKKTKLCSR